jgi:glutamate/tyrosine decarboxylase-like PLP-dependent enzyme
LHGLPRLVLFTSIDAHYSVKKLASYMGLGTDNVFLINTDEAGKMNIQHLGMILKHFNDYGIVNCGSESIKLQVHADYFFYYRK